VTRLDELAAIDDFIATHGVRWCAPRYVEPTSSYLPIALAAARLAAMQVQDPVEFSWKMAERILTLWRGRR
jgi:hypothetical protein